MSPPARQHLQCNNHALLYGPEFSIEPSYAGRFTGWDLYHRQSSVVISALISSPESWGRYIVIIRVSFHFVDADVDADLCADAHADGSSILGHGWLT